MNESIADLEAAFANVMSRLKEPPRKTERVIGMALPMGVGQEPPTRLMVFPVGEPPSNDSRKWRFERAELAKVVSDFQARTEPLPIYYEHGDGPRGKLAAGWIDSVDLARDGLYANVHWTDKAREEIRSGEWGFRSPAWDGETDIDGFIHSGPLGHLGLVNDPAIGGLRPLTASSQPSTNPTPPEKEKQMANVEAAKTKAAAFDQAGILDAVKAAFPGSDVFGDEVLCDLICKACSGAATDAPGDPMMPGAEAKPPETPAVPPAFASAEDEAKVKASATAPVTVEASEEVKKLTKENADLATKVKALEAQALSTKFISANAADRKPAPVLNFAERVRTERNASLGAARQ